MSVIGPSFGDELKAAGLDGKPITWTPDGVQDTSDLTPEEVTTLNAVVAAHDPEALPEATLAEEAFATRVSALESDPGYVDLVNKLKTMTPTQWGDYLAANMTTLAQARVVVYRMGLALMALSRSLP